MKPMAIALLLALTASAPGLALAQTAGKFDRTPTGQDMATYYPPRAMSLGREGQVVMDCVAQADGLVAECSIAAESPDGLGFGAAAIKLSKLFRIREEARVAGAHIRIPINFRLAR